MKTHIRPLSFWGESMNLALKPEELGTDEDPKPVWIQLAKPGTFKGHPSGKPFTLNRAVFEQAVRNFKANKDGRLPIDFEHASEQAPTEGSTPITGAPAQGWIVDLALRPDGNLWALVEWGPLARQYIKEGQYRFISPAIHLRMKDRETGADIGAYISSAGLTNQPFLDGMQPLAARADGGGFAAQRALALVTLDLSPSDVHKPAGGEFLKTTLRSASDYMPQLRACLGLSELATHEEMRTQLARLSERCSLADANGIHEGVDLRAKYLNSLAECAGVAASATMQDVLDVVQGMIDTAIAEHEQRYHEGETPSQMSARQPADATPTTPTHTEDSAMKTAEQQLSEATTKITTLETEVTTLTTKAKGIETELTTLRTTVAGHEKLQGDVVALCKAKGFAIGSKADGTSESVVDLVTRILDEHGKLLTAKKERDEADIVRDVELVMEQRGPGGLKEIAEEKKPALLKLRRSDPVAFTEMYPPLTQEQVRDGIRLLTRSPQGTPPARKMPPATPQGGEKVTLSHSALTTKLMREKGLNFRAAQDEATRIMNEQTAANGAAAGQ